jgi:hypothetical protein
MQLAIRNLQNVLVCSQVTATFAFVFVPRRTVCAHTINVFAIEGFSPFAVMQSRVHETWARFFGSSLEDRLRYTPSDCFETFPFSANWNTNRSLEAAGKAYYEFRESMMIRNNEGLTKIYNHFHDRDEREPTILEFRELHAVMDRAVLDAYGWTDIPTDCDFFLDHQIDDEEWGDKKKPYRYRWPDEVRDEVLARLLELNAERAREEARAGVTVDTKKSGVKPGAKRARKTSEARDLLS